VKIILDGMQEVIDFVTLVAPALDERKAIEEVAASLGTSREKLSQAIAEARAKQAQGGSDGR
jgi:hypothetical protein